MDAIDKIRSVLAEVQESKLVYVVETTVDEYGSKGGTAGVYSRRERASDVQSYSGYYGGRGNMRTVPAIRAGDKWYTIELIAVDLDDEEKNRLEELRESAKNKLTPDEIAALGI